MIWSWGPAWLQLVWDGNTGSQFVQLAWIPGARSFFLDSPLAFVILTFSYVSLKFGSSFVPGKYK